MGERAGRPPVAFWCNECRGWTPVEEDEDDPYRFWCGECGERYVCDECGYLIDRSGNCTFCPQSLVHPRNRRPRKDHHDH
jgi:hypothetical protein